MALPNPPVLTDVIGKTEALEVSWEQVTGSVLNYIIYYGTAPGVYSGSLVVPVASLSDPSAPQHDVTGLVNNSTYWVAVSAVEVGTELETAKSSELSAVTVTSQVVQQPSNLAVAANNGSVTLSWDSAAMDGFRIEYTRDVASPRQWNGTGATEGNSPIEVEGNISEYTITGLENNDGTGAPYFFRVYARKVDTYSPPTEEMVGIPQASLTGNTEGNYVKLVLKTGTNIVSLPLVPSSFVQDTRDFGKFLGADQIFWKEGGKFISRVVALPDFISQANKVLEPMEAVLVTMPASATDTTKYLIGQTWKNV